MDLHHMIPAVKVCQRRPAFLGLADSYTVQWVLPGVVAQEGEPTKHNLWK